MASSGGQQHKISPRKFSEKIALLNKKEAEGKAEFEAIIKEVQATRSLGSAGNGPQLSSNNNNNKGTTGRAGRQVADERNKTMCSDPMGPDQFEEAFENLIRRVGRRYEQEQEDLEREQEQISSSNNYFADEQSPSACMEDFDPTAIRSARATGAANLVAPIASSQLPAQPLNNSSFPSHHPNQSLQPFTATANATLSFNSGEINSETDDIGNTVDFSPLEAARDNFSGAHDESSSLNEGGGHVTATSTACRARVTSIGSANSRYICSSNSNNNNSGHHQGHQQQTRSHHQGAWMTTGDGGFTYLRPTSDKWWQKSCSDPALHLPCAPISINGNTDTSCSDNLLAEAMEASSRLADDSMMANSEQQENLGPEMLGQGYHQLPLESIPAANTTIESSLKADQQRQCFHHRQFPAADQQQQHHYSTHLTQQSSSLQSAANSSISGGAECGAGVGGTRTQQQQLALNNRQYNDDTSLSVMNADLPGIKICAIDDDNSLSRPDHTNHHRPQQLTDCPSTAQAATGATTPQSREGSLSDLANLQFSGSGSTVDQTHDGAGRGCGDNFQAAGQPPDHHQRQAQQQAYNSPEAAYAQDEYQMAQLPVCQSNSANLEQFNRAAVGGQTTTHNSHIISTMSWSPDNSHTAAGCGAAAASALYAPKVNSLLSNSERGLTTHHNQTMDTSDLYNNIIRSHSHNSIDYLTKRQREPGVDHSVSGHHHHHHHQNGPHHRYQGHHNQLLNQYEHDMNRFGLSAGARVKYCASNTSIRPQHGSISPLDSSSNLASPQSEQNSPGSSTTEYGDYLPFPSSANLMQQQHQHQHQSHGNSIGDPVASYMTVGLSESAPTGTQVFECTSAPQQGLQQSVYHHQSQCYQPNTTPPSGQKQQPHLLHSQFQVPSSNCPVQQQQQQELNTSIGPCQSPSSSRRLLNQACRRANSPFCPATRGPPLTTSNNNIVGAAAANNPNKSPTNLDEQYH